MVLAAPTKSTSDTDLLARVRTGNEKIWAAFKAAQTINLDTDREHFDTEMDKVTRAIHRLDWLCQELTAHGFDKCLYDKPTCDLDEPWAFCWACPSATAHWRGTEQGTMAI